ncbi:vomeronasal type-2 receptor 1-like [Ambystoma mexicanum]|uniref:vomeronasal type-2 receptor 1-like n=1 Tax=Ambystoma mexicanum TaxID=8296 RepID=UPI0037E8B89B
MFHEREEDTVWHQWVLSQQEVKEPGAHTFSPPHVPLSVTSDDTDDAQGMYTLQEIRALRELRTAEGYSNPTYKPPYKDNKGGRAERLRAASYTMRGERRGAKGCEVGALEQRKEEDEEQMERIESGCRLYTPKANGLLSDGDILLGGIFVVHKDIEYKDINFEVKPAPITCKRFGLHLFQWLQAMVFSVEEINRNSNLLPNLTLGFRIYDSCNKLQRALEGTLWVTSGQEELIPNFDCHENIPLLGIIGDAGSSCSIGMARVLGLYRFPQISYVSSSPILRDRTQFPSFFRTIASDDFQSQGLAQLIIYFGWTWVGLLVEDNEYGRMGAHILQLELAKAGACIAFSEEIMLSRADRNAGHIIQVIQGSTANIVIIFCSEAGLAPLMDEMVRHNVTGKIWIASEAWATSALLASRRYSEILNGTMGFAIHSGEMPGFEQHLNSVHPSGQPNDSLIQRFWEEAFGCKWFYQESPMYLSDNTSNPCTGSETMSNIQISYNDVAALRASYNVYQAVYAIALAFQDLRSCRTGDGPFHHGTCADIMDFQPWQLLYYVKNLRLPKEGQADLFFNQHGEVSAKYDIVNWQPGPGGNMRHVTVGSYDDNHLQGQNLFLHTSAIQWGPWGFQVPLSVCSPSCISGFRKAAREGQPTCCFLCVPCAQGEVSNQSDSSKCSRCSWDQWPNHRQDKCIPKDLEFLSYNEVLGTSLTIASFACSLAPLAILKLFIHYRNTPIVKANNRSLSYLLLLSLTLCFLSSLAFIGYPTLEKCRLRQSAFGITFSLCVSCILAKTIMVVIAFNATRPNSDLRRWVGPKLSYTVVVVGTVSQVLLCVSWSIVNPPFTEFNTHIQPGKLTIGCNEGSPIAFWCMLGYLGLLATISFIVAFLARKLPSSFNEAQFITFSMIAFLSVWLSFIPAYLSTQGKYMVAMEIFAILTSASTLMACIFFPKCFIIILRPERNIDNPRAERQGAVNFSKEEFGILVVMVLENYNSLFEPAKQRSKYGRCKLWEDITAAINAEGVAVCCLKSIHKRWEDLKSKTHTNARHAIKHCATIECHRAHRSMLSSNNMQVLVKSSECCMCRSASGKNLCSLMGEEQLTISKVTMTTMKHDSPACHIVAYRKLLSARCQRERMQEAGQGIQVRVLGANQGTF